MGQFQRSFFSSLPLMLLFSGGALLAACSQEVQESRELSGIASNQELNAPGMVLGVVTPVVSCDSLVSYDLMVIGGEGSEITSAQLSEHEGHPVCEVEGNLAPTIGFKALLPTETWTQRYLQTGCGGLCGSLNIRVGAADGCEPLTRGEFVLASTNMGHSGRGADFGDDPQKRIDFAYRGVHLTAVATKALINAFYGQEAAYSYFSGCSDGGREALIEAQRFPEDFDGILAGAPAANFSVQNSFYHAWNARSNSAQDGSAILTEDQLALLEEAAVAACDALDGLEDGLITDPRLCNFDPSSLQCDAGGDSANCLTAEQVQVVSRIYKGPQDPESGMTLTLGGPMPGSEAGWGIFIPSADRPPFSAMIAGDALGGLIYETNPSKPYSLDQFEFTEASFDRIRPLNGLYSGTNPDLSGFRDSGGKLLLWHGWADQHISPINTIAYLEAVEDLFGVDAAADFAKLYLLPGVSHCGRGAGPDNLDLLTAVMSWVEKGEAPYAIETRKYAEPENTDIAGVPGENDAALVKAMPGIERSRPVYPYPLVASYTGEGSIDEASSYTAVEGMRGPESYHWAGSDLYQAGSQINCRVIESDLVCE